MKKLLIVLGALVALVVVILIAVFIGVNVYLGSEGFRAGVERSVSEAVGTPVKIAGIHVGLTGKLDIDGIAIPQKEPLGSENLLSIRKVAVDARLRPLLQDKVEIVSVDVEQVDVILRQTKEGGLLLPFAMAGDAKTGGAPEGPGAEGGTFQLNASVESINIGPVNLKVYDAGNAVLAAVEGLQGTGSASMVAGEPAANLQLSVKTLEEVTPGLKIREVVSPLVYSGGKVQLQPLKASLYEGIVTGSADAGVGEEGKPFTADLKIEGSNLGKLLGDLGGKGEAPALEGVLKGDFKGQGSLDAPKDLRGGGTFEIREVLVTSLKKKGAAGKIMGLTGALAGIKPLHDGKFDSITGSYRIEGQAVRVKDLLVSSPSLKISLDGTVTFDKQLDMKGKVKVDSNILTDVVGEVEGVVMNLFSGDSSGSSDKNDKVAKAMKEGIPFTVKGPADNPTVRTEGLDPIQIIPILAKALGLNVGESPKKEKAEATKAPSDPAVKLDDLPRKEEPKKEESGLKDLLKF